MSLPVINSTGIPVVWQTRPFGGDTRHVMVSPNGRMPSIAEIVAGIPELPDSIRVDGHARINGLLVQRDFWPYVRPKYRPGSVGVTLHHTLEKGGNAGSIIAIAALIAATAVSAGTLGPLTGGLLAAGSWAAIGTSAAITVTASLAMTALAPPPISDEGTSNTATSPEVGNAALGNNGIEKRGSLQRVIGTYRVPPQRLTDVLIEQVGQDLWAECIYGLAGPHKIWEIYFDGQLVDVSTNNNVQIETREGWVSDAALTLITRQPKTDAIPINLSQHKINTAIAGDGHAGSRLSDSEEAFNDLAVIAGSGAGGPQDDTRTIDVTKIVPQWHRFTTRAAPDEFWIAMEYQQGLYNQSANPSAGVFYYNGNAVRLRARRKGDSTWINFPELHISGGLEPKLLRETIKLIWSDPPDSVIPNPVSLDSPGFYIAYKNVPGRTVDSPTTAGWTADARFSGGTVVNASRDQALSSKNQATTNVRNTWLFQDRAELYLGSTGTFEHTGSGIWEIEIRQSEFYLAKALWGTGSPNSDTNSPGSYTYWDGAFQTALTDGNVHDFFEYRAMAANDYHSTMSQSNSQYKLTIVRRSNIWNEYPITEAGTDENRLAKIAIRVRNQSVGVITVKASGYIHVYSGGNWNSYAVSSNPAENFREILNGQLGKLPQDVPAINDASILSWRQHCIDNDYTIDTVVAGKSYRDVLKLVASAGWARVRDAEQWGVIIDKDRSSETPGQIFTAREVSEFSINKPFARLPDGFRATFLNEDDDYINDEVVVLDPLNPEADEGRVEEVAYAAFTDPVKVEARATFDLLQLRLRSSEISFSTDAAGFMAERGDLIGLNYDIFARKYGSGRIKQINVSGGLVQSIVLDGTVPVSTGTDDVSSIYEIVDIYEVDDIYLLAGVSTTYARIRKLGGAGYIDFELDGSLEDSTDTLVPNTPFADPGRAVFDLDAVVWVGNLTDTERRLIVKDIQPKDQTQFVITCVDEAPDLWAA